MEKLKIGKFSFSIEKIYLLILGFIAFLPIAAPILLNLGLGWLAKKIYFIYSFFCHQFSERSLYLFDTQFAWCARDTGIWTGIFFTALAVKFFKLKPIKWYFLLLFLVPIALDGGIQTISTIRGIGVASSEIFYLSNNFFRYVTGFFLGMGVSLWISPQIINKAGAGVTTKKFLAIFFLGVVFYLVLVFLWQVTSYRVLPSNILDSVAKERSEMYFERRKDAPCPTSGIADIIQIDCFFKE